MDVWSARARVNFFGTHNFSTPYSEQKFACFRNQKESHAKYMVKPKKHLKSVLMKKYNMSVVVETVETVKTSLVP